MSEIIARYTTPAITYKPSVVSVENIDEIFLVIKQQGHEKFRKSIDDASVSENGFTWLLSQEETSALCPNIPSSVQIDYLSGAMRYTTIPKLYNITESAISEVI